VAALQGWTRRPQPSCCPLRLSLGLFPSDVIGVRHDIPLVYRGAAYAASLGPRDLRGLRARPTFEVATTSIGAVHLAERGQAGRAEVRALCGVVLPSYPRVTLDADIAIACDRCRRLRITRQKWTRA